MKNISRSKVEEAVKNAEKEAHAWCMVDSRHSYQIVIDTDDAEIWVDAFADCNSWKQYRSESILSLDVRAPGGRTEDAIYHLLAAGWEITE